MKRVFGLAVSAGLVFAATAADAQMLAPYRAVSDFDGPYERPYGAIPPAPPPPVYNYGGYGPPPGLMPMTEVYAVLRDNGFSPLGVPHQRGFVYTVAVIDRNGDDGRLVIDGRNGRIIRFVPAGPGWGPGGGPGGGYGRGGYDESFNAVPVPGYGPQGALPPPSVIRGAPRPPGSVPHVASRAVPLPAPKPAMAGKPPEVAPQRSAAVEPKPEVKPVTPPAPVASAPPAASTQTAQTAPPVVAPPVPQAKPAPAIRPTQPMPAAQGLE
jgi:hypothetical protein